MKHPIINDSLYSASPYWLGTWSMSGERYGACQAEDAQATLEMAYASGLRVFDTAPVYGRGQAELLLGKVFRKKRESVFFSSKVGLCWHGRNYSHNASPTGIQSSFESSCKRLNTDYIDLLSLHWPDENVDICESVQTLINLQKNGCIRYWGVCNLNEMQLQTIEAEFGTPIHQTPLSPYSICQNKSRLSPSRITCAVSVFQHGLLLPENIERQFGKKDHRNASELLKSSTFLNWRLKFKKVLSEHNVPPTTQVLQYMLSLQNLNVVVLGARSILQFNDVLPTLKMENSLRDEIVDKIKNFVQVNE